MSALTPSNALDAGSTTRAAPPSGMGWDFTLADVRAFGGLNNPQCNLKPSDIFDFSAITQTIYVDYAQPTSSGDGSSWANAEKGIHEAIETAVASALPTRIKVKGGIYPRFYAVGGTSSEVMTLSAPLVIEAVYGEVLVIAGDELSWSANATYSNVYESARSVVNSVVRIDKRDDEGIPIRLEGVASLADCASTPDSFYTDNVTTYVHLVNDEVVSNENCRVLMNVRSCEIDTNNHDFCMTGLTFIGGNTGLKLRGGTTNNIVCNNVRAHHQMNGNYGSETGIDGFAILDCGLFAGFDCNASMNSKDGFNFHITAGQLPTGLLVGCKANNSGAIISSSTSCNGVTAHDGVKLIDIGGEYLNGFGTQAGHVNDNTKVWHYGTRAGYSEGDVVNGGSIDYGAFGSWDGACEVWIEQCEAVSSSKSAVATGTASLYYRDFTRDGSLVGNVSAY